VNWTDTCLLIWVVISLHWSPGNRANFRILSEMANIYLVISPGSVPVESMFSTAGLMLKDDHQWHFINLILCCVFMTIRRGAWWAWLTKTYQWPPIVMGRPLYFAAVVTIFLFFLFPRLFSRGRKLDVDVPWACTWCGLSANLECRSEMCCMRLAEMQDAKITPKIAICASSQNFVGLRLRN